MPNRNGTGPEGKGPRTGRGVGPCNDERNAVRGGRGRRNGAGFGAERGFGSSQAEKDNQGEVK